MRRLVARLWIGGLVLGLGLALVPAAQAQTATERSAGAGLARSVESNRRAVTSGKTISATVRKGFVAINAANKKLYACKWGDCTGTGKKLRKVARHWLGVLRPLKGETKTVSRGLGTARASLGYWAKTGRDVIRADAAAKAKKPIGFNYWYKRYRSDYKLGVKYQNRAVNILSKG